MEAAGVLSVGNVEQHAVLVAARRLLLRIAGHAHDFDGGSGLAVPSKMSSHRILVSEEKPHLRLHGCGDPEVYGFADPFPGEGPRSDPDHGVGSVLDASWRHVLLVNVQEIAVRIAKRHRPYRIVCFAEKQPRVRQSGDARPPSNPCSRTDPAKDQAFASSS